MNEMNRLNRLTDRAHRVGFVINRHYGTPRGGYQVSLLGDPADRPEAVFGRDFDLDLDDVEAVIEGAEASTGGTVAERHLRLVKP